MVVADVFVEQPSYPRDVVGPFEAPDGASACAKGELAKLEEPVVLLQIVRESETTPRISWGSKITQIVILNIGIAHQHAALPATIRVSLQKDHCRAATIAHFEVVID